MGCMRNSPFEVRNNQCGVEPHTKTPLYPMKIIVLCINRSIQKTLRVCKPMYLCELIELKFKMHYIVIKKKSGTIFGNFPIHNEKILIK